MKSLDRLHISISVLRAETSDLTPEEVGVYLRMILFQWEAGALPSTAERLSAICGSFVSDVVLSKFEAGSDGTLRAFWLEQQRKREIAFRQKASKYGKSRWLPKGYPKATLENTQQCLCACGCGNPVKPGRKFVDRTHANRFHGEVLFAGKPRENVIQEKAGKGEASGTDRYRSSL